MSAATKLAREYELIYIMRPTVGPSEAKKVSGRITDLLEKYGARLTRVDQWGKRKLAYTIKNHTRGQFVYLKFVGFADVIDEIERNLRNLDEVIRWQTVRLEGLFDLAALEVDPEEIEFHELEAEDAEDDEPTFEERLGMKKVEPQPEPPAEDEAKAEGEGAEGESAEGESEDAKSEGEPEEAKSEGEPEAESEGEPEAKAEGGDDEEGKE